MRITIVEPDGFGGLAHYAYEMANALADAGADVTLITAREYELVHLPHRCRLETSLALWRNVSRDPDWAARLPYAVRLLRRRLLRVPRAVRLLVVWTRLTRQLLHDRPDIVVLSEIRFPFLAHFLRRMRRAGLTLTQVCHEFEPRERGWIGRALARRRGRRLYDAFSAIVFLGERVRQAFLASFPVDPARTHVVALGALTLLTDADAGPPDLRAHYGIAPGAPVALFFGGLRPSKGIDDLLPAFARVLQELPTACLVVAGTPLRGVRAEQYVTRAQALGIGHAVRVDPAYVPVERVGALMRTATVVVLPYRSGTASGVIQAAYAFGRPVVVTRVGAIAEAVDAGGTGLVVEPGDAAALAAAMVTLMRDPARAESMGAAARTLVSGRHAWPAIAETMLDVMRAAQAGAGVRDRS